MRLVSGSSKDGQLLSDSLVHSILGLYWDNGNHRDYRVYSASTGIGTGESTHQRREILPPHSCQH